MALHGQVSTMPLPDLFQWIGNSKKSGGLSVRHSNSTTRVSWSDGRISGCSSDDPPKLLGQFLLFHGLLTEDVLRGAMAEQETTGRGLPEILVEMDSLTGADIDRVATAKTREAILGLFEWDEAEFYFDKTESAGPNVVRLDLEVQEVLLDGMKRLDDKERIATIFKDPSMVVAHTSAEPAPELSTDWPKRKVYMSVDGERTIEEITLRVHGTEFRVGMILLDLFQDGFIETRELRPFGTRTEQAPVESDAPDTIRDTEIAREEFLDRIPVPTKPRHEIAEQGVSADEDFLLSLSDGIWDVRSLTWVAPMRAADVLTGLKRLHERGFVELRAP